MMMLPQVSWLFFEAVRAGLAVKRPYLDSYGSIRRGGGNRPRPGGLRLKMGRLGKRIGCRRVGVCKASSTPSRPPDHYSGVEKQSYFPRQLRF